MYFILEAFAQTVVLDSMIFEVSILYEAAEYFNFSACFCYQVWSRFKFKYCRFLLPEFCYLIVSVPETVL